MARTSTQTPSFNHGCKIPIRIKGVLHSREFEIYHGYFGTVMNKDEEQGFVDLRIDLSSRITIRETRPKNHTPEGR
jgi:ribosomal protein L21E